MDEPTTTTEESVDTGVQDTQPVNTEQTEAVQENVIDDQQSNQEPSEDDTSKWLQSKGIDPSDPEALNKVAKSAREAEKAFHAKAKKASELEKGLVQGIDNQIEEQGLSDEDLTIVQRLAVSQQKTEIKQAVRDFWDENPDAKQYESQMIEVLAENQHLAGDLEALYAKALLRSNALESSRSEGGREALNKLANKQRAASPTGSAVNSNIPSNRITRDVIRERTQAGDVEWLDNNQTEINRLVSEGLLN